MKLDSRNVLWGGIIFIVVILGLWGVWKFTTVPADLPEEVVQELEVKSDDNIKGATDGQVVLVEYSDLQCPACRAYAPLVEQLIANNEGTVTFVYRHFPLGQHEFAKVAAYAAEAAGNQGAFFDYHDILFERQDDWSTGENLDQLFEEYATELELDIETFNADRASDEVKKKVEDQLASGLVAGVNATPTFFLNGQKLVNPNSIEAFQKLIDAELSSGSVESSEEASPSGTTEEPTDDAADAESTDETTEE